ncbi:MAG: CSLREA domain-containing protein [Acidobacteria bacterium]|nr:CSLREA domain-containing protein [Acidobacteriota bacterium]
MPRPIRLCCALVAALALAVALSSSQAASAATFTVNSLGDTSDATPGDGACADASGACTLRAAIREANALPGNDTINFSVTGTINLTGALPDIASNMTITGPGSSLLTVRRDTGGDYRIFTVTVSGVTISGLTITNGKTPDGGPPTSPYFGTDGGSGGGIMNSGTLTLTDVVVTGNRTGNGGRSTVTSAGGAAMAGESTAPACSR